MTKLALLLATLWVAHPLCAQPGPATYYEGQVEPRSGENFSFAQYCCWLPTKPQETRGVLCVVLHPHGNTGVKFDNPQPWIELAERYRCALLSLSFVDAADQTKNWSHAFGGSGRALLAATTEVAATSGIVKLASSRIVLAGICEAGQFAYGFSAYAPERAAAFMTMGGALHEVPLAGRAADIPGLLVAAIDRGPIEFDNMFSLFTAGRSFCAPWEFSLESIKDYDDGHSSALVKDFLDKALSHIQGPGLPISSAGGQTVPSAVQATRSQDTESNAEFTEIYPGYFDGNSQGWFQPWEASAARYLASFGSPSALSFVSVPLPAMGHAEMSHVNLGTIHLATGALEQITTVFRVYSDQEPAVDGVAVASDLKGFSWQAARVGTGEWQLRCNLNSSAIPSGAFIVPVPIRFVAGNKIKPGGITTFVSGRIFRDVSPEPSAINFGSNHAANKRTRLRLKSASGVSINVLGIESSMPGVAKAEIAGMGDGCVELDCSCEPSMDLPRTFSGYYLLRVKSDREQTLRVLFFGENAEGGR